MGWGPGALRLLLSLVVVVQHLSSLRLGLVAVAVFFMLSGYWVTRLYDQDYRQGDAPVFRFYLSRVLRVWLPFVAAILIAMALYAAIGLERDPAHWWALPLLGISTHNLDPLGISWSLDLELQFYLLMPLLLPLVAAVPPVWTAAVTVVLWLAAISLERQTGISLVFVALPAFVAGMAMHLGRLRAGRTWALGSVIVFAAACGGALLFPATRGAVIYTPSDSPVIPIAVVLSLALAPFVLWTIQCRSRGLDRLMGDFSYALYLVHYPLIIAAGHLLGRDFGPVTKLALIVLSLVLSAAFFVLVDRPLERVRQGIMAKVNAKRRLIPDEPPLA